MYEMPLIYVFWGWGEHFLYRGFKQWHFVIGVLSGDPAATQTSVNLTAAHHTASNQIGNNQSVPYHIEGTLAVLYHVVRSKMFNHI